MKWIAKSSTVLIAINVWLCNVCGDEDYEDPVNNCQAQCIRGEVTSCSYPDVPGKNCVQFDEFGSNLPLEEEVALLDAHNKYRSEVATGHETRGLDGEGQPPAADMMALVWDTELADKARRWALQCTFGANECMHTENGEEIGQLVVEWTKNFPPVTDAIEQWSAPVTLFSSALIHSVPKEISDDLGSYTQLVWSTARKLGCGRAKHMHGMWGRTSYLVCNYLPRGNLVNVRVYEMGQPCSACPDGAECSTRYPGLCKLTELESDRAKVPEVVDSTEQPDEDPDESSTVRSPKKPVRHGKRRPEIPDELIKYYDPLIHGVLGTSSNQLDKDAERRCSLGSTFTHNPYAGVGCLFILALLTLDCMK